LSPAARSVEQATVAKKVKFIDVLNVGAVIASAAAAIAVDTQLVRLIIGVLPRTGKNEVIISAKTKKEAPAGPSSLYNAPLCFWNEAAAAAT
jgi:hypothetical protein